MTPARQSTLDVAAVERGTGWRVVALASAGSTNDEAARIRDAAGADAMPADRVVVVADQQTAGRGRGGHAFSSPPGGLYASLCLRVSADDLPAPLVFAAAVALAEAVERTTSLRPAIKWPNDLWIGEKKVAGILLETASEGRRPAGDASDERPAASSVGTVAAIVGLGVNLRAVPGDLAPEVSRLTTALDRETGTATSREALLAHLLERLDHWRSHLGTREGRERLEAAYRERLALRGAAVRWLVGEEERRGVLRDVSLERGVLLDEPAGLSSLRGAAWHNAAHVREMRPDRR